MPRCQGLPDGRCPQNINNKTVKLSQGDLMLCPSCEAVRFPYVVKQSTKQSTKQVQAANGKKKATTSAMSKEFDTVSVSYQSDSDEDCCCSYCNETITPTSSSIKCDTCKNVYHQTCAGYSDEVFATLTGIIVHTGWVCQQCRAQFSCLKSSLAQVTDELAEMRASLAGVIAEVNYLKNMPRQHVSASLNHAATIKPGNSDSSSSHGKNVSDVESDSVTIAQVRLEFFRTYQDVTRRKCNVIITGLPEADTEDAETDKEVDSMTFVKFCEENLSVKPALAPSGCVRLGKSDGVRPCRLLVHLTSETSATSLLLASKVLRQNDDTRNVYFNPDLTKMEAKLAYEKRVEKTPTSSRCS